MVNLTSLILFGCHLTTIIRFVMLGINRLELNPFQRYVHLELKKRQRIPCGYVNSKPEKKIYGSYTQTPGLLT